MLLAALLEGWSLRVARNAIADHHRARRPEVPTDAPVLELLPAGGEEDDDARASLAALARCLPELVRHLPGAACRCHET